MRTLKAIAAVAVAAVLSTGCGPAAAPPGAPAPEGSAPALPPIPSVRGELAIDVVYPGEDQTLGVRDSTFIFGNVGTGEATLTIDDQPVEVAANGAFLAFLSVPQDGVYDLVATAGGRSVQLARTVELPAVPSPTAPSDRLFIDPASVTPTGVFTEMAGTPFRVRFRGTPGANARLVLPDGRVVPLRETTTGERLSEYTGTFPVDATLIAPDTAVGWPTLGGIPEPPREERSPGGAVVELIRGADTVRTPLQVSLGVLPEGTPRVGVAASSRLDDAVIGTAVPGSGTPYHWFFPNATRFNITGELGGQYRVRLTEELSVWVNAGDVDLLPLGHPPVEGSVGTVRATPAADFVDLTLFTSERLPFRVDASERGITVNVYGARTRTNILQYGREDPLIERIEWEQPGEDLYRVHVDLAEPFWGYLPYWDEEGNLVVRIRRPPAIDPRQPLRGLYIGVDAGHPPGGAIGPTRFTEAEANLAIAKRLIPMLRERGARVLEIRPDTAAVGLGVRPQMATDSSVHLLVSIHNDAFPDGVNPFLNAGTHVFYNQPQSLDLSRALQRELLGELRLRDLGISRRDLALVRPTWMPSALTESMFMMIPQQEAALRDPSVQERIARAHLRGIEAFLRGRAAAAR